MPRLRDTSIAVLVGAVVVLSVACAPRSARWSATRGLAPCNGVPVIDIQNDLGVSIQILETGRSAAQQPRLVAFVGPGYHTVEVDHADRRRYHAQTVGQSSFASYSIGPHNPNVRMVVRCRGIG